jgi:radical SAM-linked protein
MTQRFRITYARTEALRYIGNLDMQKVWERYVRRLKVPIAYSQGFHPQAKIQQACPLPLGFLSTCEITDIWVDDDLAILKASWPR